MHSVKIRMKYVSTEESSDCTEILQWCFEQYGEGCYSHPLMTSNARWRWFKTFYYLVVSFTYEEDAMMFALRWVK